MTHVSRHPLRSRARKRIDKQLLVLLSKRPVGLIARELLTETERLMLAKRLAAILMLTKGFSYYRIGQILRMSTSSIRRFDGQLVAGDFPFLEKLVRNANERKALWSSLTVILRAGLPPKGVRWKTYRRDK
jgi:hypothetical protein